MAATKLVERVAALEAEMTRLKGKIEKLTGPEVPWWKEIEGTFLNDPIYEEAMRLGREYRESLRPKPPRRGKGTDGRP